MAFDGAGSGLYVRETADGRGRGLYTGRDFQNGALLCPFFGPVLQRSELSVCFRAGS